MKKYIKIKLENESMVNLEMFLVMPITVKIRNGVKKISIVLYFT